MMRRGPRSVPVLMFAALVILDLSGPLPAAALVLEPAAGLVLAAAALEMVRSSLPRRAAQRDAVVLHLPVQRNPPEVVDLRETPKPRV